VTVPLWLGSDSNTAVTLASTSSSNASSSILTDNLLDNLFAGRGTWADSPLFYG
jgi:hypothetical protein